MLLPHVSYLKKQKHNYTWFLLMYIETVLSNYLLANALLGHAHN